MMSSLQYHNLVTPPAIPSQRGLDCGKIQSSCHCTMAPFSSIPLLKTDRIWREVTCIWRSGSGQILFGAIRNIWAEPNCVRVVHMVLAYTFSTSGRILPSLVKEPSRSMKIRQCISQWKRALDGYTDGLFWSFDTDSLLIKLINPERSKSHSVS